MKKRTWMTFVFILVIMFVPRYNNHPFLLNREQHLPGRKLPAEGDEQDFPMPGKWLLMSILHRKKVRSNYVFRGYMLAHNSGRRTGYSHKNEVNMLESGLHRNKILKQLTYSRRQLRK